METKTETQARFTAMADQARAHIEDGYKIIAQFAARMGVLWAWDPSIGKFRIAPADTAIARGMIEYAYEQWSKSGKSINHLIEGAAGSGFVSKHVKNKTLARNDAARDAIETAESKIRYREV